MIYEVRITILLMPEYAYVSKIVIHTSYLVNY